MRAVVFRGVERVEVADVPDPVIEAPGDAIVRVGLTAICGSDLHLYHGKAPLEPGDTIGHEAIGVIEQVGPAVTRFAPGQRVVVSFDIACGECWFCRKGQTQLCEDFGFLGYGMFGGSLGGAQAELLRVPVADVNLLAVPAGLEDDRALFVGDALTTGVYARRPGRDHRRRHGRRRRGRIRSASSARRRRSRTRPRCSRSIWTRRGSRWPNARGRPRSTSRRATRRPRCSSTRTGAARTS